MQGLNSDNLVIYQTGTGTEHKGLKSPKRFTNLPLGSISSILNLMGLMHPYGSLVVTQAPKSYNELIFKNRKKQDAFLHLF